MSMRPVAAVLLVVLASVATIAAQAPARQGAPAAPPAKSSAPASPAAVDKPVLPPLEPQGYTYDPDSRRDPFVSLVRRGADTRETIGSRPSGLPGLATSEVSLKGIITSGSGYVAVVQGADNKTYIVHVGDKLLDGTVRAITADSMVILQQVNDPLSTQKQREVRKGLRQTEEAK